MPRRFRVFAPLVIVGLLALAFSAGATSLHKQPGAADGTSATGNLTAVDPETHRLTMVLEGTLERVELRLEDAVEIWQGSRQLSVPALAAHQGRRIKVRYRVGAGLRSARMVTVEPQAAR